VSRSGPLFKNFQLQSYTRLLNTIIASKSTRGEKNGRRKGLQPRDSSHPSSALLASCPNLLLHPSDEANSLSLWSTALSAARSVNSSSIWSDTSCLLSSLRQTDREHRCLLPVLRRKDCLRGVLIRNIGLPQNRAASSIFRHEPLA
jgi:hypothetical protein